MPQVRVYTSYECGPLSRWHCGGLCAVIDSNYTVHQRLCLFQGDAHRDRKFERGKQHFIGCTRRSRTLALKDISRVISSQLRQTARSIFPRSRGRLTDDDLSSICHNASTLTNRCCGRSICLVETRKNPRRLCSAYMKRISPLYIFKTFQKAASLTLFYLFSISSKPSWIHFCPTSTRSLERPPLYLQILLQRLSRLTFKCSRT